MNITIAGRAITEPQAVISKYADTHSGTVRRYDLTSPDCGSDSVCGTEVKQTRVIASRISNKQGEQMLDLLADAPWGRVPPSADLRDADPGVRGGLYDAMSDLYMPLLGIEGVGNAKVSKLLHLKRRALFPILDSKLMRLYDRPARATAQRHPEREAKRLYWAVIREDVILNQGALEDLRRGLRGRGGLTAQVAVLSDVRLLDILAWRL